MEFIDRYRNPSSSPVINNDDGTVSTHKMEYSGVDGRYIAYPTIAMIDGSLVDLGPQALDYAMYTGQFKEFDTEPEAAKYAYDGYKSQWGADETRKGSHAGLLSSFGL
tara:strand:- start:8 stop:331 length:324 start_codon:yes stop_codon:yes gene_type:complete